ncbi:NADH-ubiquinone oxidoreductase-F iron-sulfur binding region domain-containing protein [Gordonia crocea]|uniref:NADH dehydrogenase n=1 Tax=Gordonia crocea TaxID=589162 RepID=A0A7I9UW83_9ACTN|nr:NADH-ubiquinone oxidoreductase-F iron-sulfur binding region domain-containing protein [Gordonia crocea]GED97106.1 NADH dehydrogenase [Gordonia crocea]
MRALAGLLTAAGLTGRGGADFPTGAKVALAADHGADLIVNACDGELDARKDGWVVAHHLAEMLAGARAVTRGTVRVAARRGSATLAHLHRAGVATVSVPGRYVASEESALVSLVHGGSARPVMRFEPIAAGARDGRGRRLRPTLVLNAETVWRISQIADRGARWFRSFGSRVEPGPRLVALVDGVAEPGVYEAEAGMSTAELLALGGGPTGVPGALWFGGLAGGFVPAAEPALRWSRVGLARFGTQPGSGVVRVVDDRSDPWPIVLGALAYAAGESSGQCGPCMFGVPALRDGLLSVLVDPAPARITALTRRIEGLPGRGACRYPDGVAGFLDSALRSFPIGGRP